VGEGIQAGDGLAAGQVPTQVELPAVRATVVTGSPSTTVTSWSPSRSFRVITLRGGRPLSLLDIHVRIDAAVPAPQFVFGDVAAP